MKVRFLHQNNLYVFSCSWFQRLGSLLFHLFLVYDILDIHVLCDFVSVNEI